MLAFIKKLPPHLLVILLLISLSFNVYYLFLNKTDIKTPNSQQDEFPKEAYIPRVIDGDTIVLNSGQYVRLNGVNAPEGNTPAKAYLDNISENNKKVFLEYDRPQKDQYGRLLAWVWIDCEDTPQFLPADYMHKSQNESNVGLKDNPTGCKNGKLVNEELVKNGYAKIEDYKDRGKLKYEERIFNHQKR